MRYFHLLLSAINTGMLCLILYVGNYVLEAHDNMLCDLINNTGGICIKKSPDIHPGQNNRNVFCPKNS